MLVRLDTSVFNAADLAVLYFVDITAQRVLTFAVASWAIILSLDNDPTMITVACFSNHHCGLGNAFAHVVLVSCSLYNTIVLTARFGFVNAASSFDLILSARLDNSALDAFLSPNTTVRGPVHRPSHGCSNIGIVVYTLSSLANTFAVAKLRLILAYFSALAVKDILSALYYFPEADNSTTGLLLHTFAALLYVLSIAAWDRYVLPPDVSDALAAIVGVGHCSLLPAHGHLDTSLEGAGLLARCTVASLGLRFCLTFTLNQASNFFQM